MHVSSLLAASTSLLTLSHALAINNTKRGTSNSFQYASEKVRGVNLGGWFVLEPWITPSLFDPYINDGRSVVDEYTLSQTLGSQQASSVLNQHWATWITESDIQQIAAAGFNHVRVPIGYWAIAPLEGTPYVQGQLTYVDSLITWCRTYGINVLLDVHGVPGSQNGFDNSGQFMTNPQWQNVDPSGSLAKAAVTGLAQRYVNDQDVVSSIEPVNEPLGPVLDMGKIKQYYYDGWGTIRDSSEQTVEVIHDAFQGIDYWNGFMGPNSGVWNVMLDTHQYQVFSTPELQRTVDDHIGFACSLGSQLSSTDKWTIVGEWSGAMTDCARYLNGFNVGARYDGSDQGYEYVDSCSSYTSGSSSQLSAADKVNTRKFIEAQLDSYESKTGWIFWTWKTEQGAPGWDMQDLIANGLFPQPITAREYPGQCN